MREAIERRERSTPLQISDNPADGGFRADPLMRRGAERGDWLGDTSTGRFGNGRARCAVGGCRRRAAGAFAAELGLRRLGRRWC
jgi:hypothetical protein